MAGLAGSPASVRDSILAFLGNETAGTTKALLQEPPRLTTPAIAPLLAPPDAFVLSGAAAGCPAVVIRDGFAGPTLAAEARAAAEALCEGGMLRPAGMGRAGSDVWHDPRSRGDHILWVSDYYADNAENTEGPGGNLSSLPLGAVLRKMKAVGEDLQRRYPGLGLNLTGRASTQLAYYPPNGAGYVRHLDTPRVKRSGGAGGNIQEERRLTLLYYMNPGWQESSGGWLRILLPETIAVDVDSNSGGCGGVGDEGSSGLGGSKSDRDSGSSSGLAEAGANTYLFGRDGATEDGSRGAAEWSPHLDGGAVWDLPPLQDRLVVFRSDLVEHAVMPSHAPRFALTMWLYGANTGGPREAVAASWALPGRLRPPSKALPTVLPVSGNAVAETATADAEAGTAIGSKRVSRGCRSAAAAATTSTSSGGAVNGGVIVVHGSSGDAPAAQAAKAAAAAAGDTRAKVRPLPLPKEAAELASARRNSIFVSCVAYRDPEWLPTLIDLFERADQPERVFVGLVLQGEFAEEKTKQEQGDDVGNDGGSSGLPERYRKRVRILQMAAGEAAGPCWARHLAGQLWRGEPLLLQIDSHMRFRPNWDSFLAWQLARCLATSPKPILTAYPPPYELPHKIPVAETRPALLCPSGFGREDGLLRQAGRLLRTEKRAPVPSPLWAAGFNFSSASVLVDCPYDPSLRQLFFGEEVSMAARLFTSGYDFFAPQQAPLYHLWTRDHRPSFRENDDDAKKAERAAAEARVTDLLRLDERSEGGGNGDGASCEERGCRSGERAAGSGIKDESDGGDSSGNTAGSGEGSQIRGGDGGASKRESPWERHLDRYGLGSVRSLEEFERNVGVDLRRRIVLEGSRDGGLRPEDFDDHARRRLQQALSAGT